MAADVLSDVLRTVRLTGATFFDVVGNTPWVAEQPPRTKILPRILPGAEHLISYHVITEGRCYAALIDGEPVEVEAGEVVVFTHGDPHVMSSAPGLRAADPTSTHGFETIKAFPFFLHFGGSGPTTARLVCGFLACDARPFNPLLDHLPRVIKAGDKPGDDGWLSQFVRFAMLEARNKRAGGETVLAKLSELMFIEVVRRHVETLRPEQTGWLAGLRDPFVGRALSLLHAAPTRHWTIEELAREVGLSRSVLAERFTDLVGIPPMQYLTQWRMQIASAMLTAGTGNVATVAAEIGYESEAAFSRAFKKMVGVPPSVWRRRGETRGGEASAALNSPHGIADSASRRPAR